MERSEKLRSRLLLKSRFTHPKERRRQPYLDPKGKGESPFSVYFLSSHLFCCLCSASVEVEKVILHVFNVGTAAQALILLSHITPH